MHQYQQRSNPQQVPTQQRRSPDEQQAPTQSQPLQVPRQQIADNVGYVQRTVSSIHSFIQELDGYKAALVGDVCENIVDNRDDVDANELASKVLSDTENVPSSGDVDVPAARYLCGMQNHVGQLRGDAVYNGVGYDLAATFKQLGGRLSWLKQYDRDDRFPEIRDVDGVRLQYGGLEELDKDVDRAYDRLHTTTEWAQQDTYRELVEDVMNRDVDCLDLYFEDLIAETERYVEEYIAAAENADTASAEYLMKTERLDPQDDPAFV